MKKVLIGLLFTIMTIGVSCCDDDWMYYYDCIGEWELIESDGYPVRRDNDDGFDFYHDGTGVYYGVDNFGYHYEEPFTWDADEYVIHINYRSYSWGSEFWYYQYKHGYLYLSDTPDFYHYNVYAPYY